MLAKMDAVEDITWDSIKAIVGIENIIKLFKESHVIGLVNWSEIENSSSIWAGIIYEVLIHLQADKRKIMFFDLSDCSRKPKEDLMQALKMLKLFNKYFKVILGLNENEARLVFNTLGGSENTEDIRSIGRFLFSNLGIDLLVIHPRKYSLAWDIHGEYSSDHFYIESPKISTGSGDNFNSGFCAAQVLNLDIPNSLLLADAVAGFYLIHGVSPDMNMLMAFLNNQI